MTTSLIILSIIFIVVGIFGAVVPFLPGLPLAFIGTFLLSYVTHFDLISVPVLVALAFLALLSLGIDFASGAIGARLGKASLWGTVGAIAGLIVGIAFFGPFGLVLGPALGVLLFELVARRDQNHALKAAKSTLLTSLLGLALSGILSLVYVIVVVIAVIF